MKLLYFLPALVVALWMAVLLPSELRAQGEIDEQETIFYNDEKTWALQAGTSGWGIQYRYGRRINAFRKVVGTIDFVGLDHPKELSLQNPWNPSTYFVYGKLNSIAVLRGSVGQQQELFRRGDKGGIAIRWFYTGGGSVVWQKPIYYEIYDPTQRAILDQRFQLDSFPTTDYILGKSSYFKGFSESSFVLGGYATAGMSFDFSKRNDRILALEAGVSLDVFLQPLDIMAGENNPFYFVQIYGNLRFGKVVDRMKVRLKRTRKEMQRRAND